MGPFCAKDGQAGGLGCAASRAHFTHSTQQGHQGASGPHVSKSVLRLLCRCPACPGKTLSEVVAGWAEEMASFLKCVDPNHLISLGTEGFFGETDGNE